MPGILVVGSLNADLVVRAPRFPQPGETISGTDLQIIPGGKGANQAVAASRLGADVSMLGRVGGDQFGGFLLDNLKANNVDTRLIRRDAASTGTAIIIVDSNGQNSIVLSPGANSNVAPPDVEDGPYPAEGLVLLQLEIPIPTVLRAAERAKENNLRVILNPAPARDIPKELITLADFIIPNETELGLLSGMEAADLSSVEKSARALLKTGAGNVIVTLGARGVLIVTSDQASHIEAYRVEPIDTTAAGDAFIGGFATTLLEGKSIEEAVRFGCACGALAATKFGAQPSLPTREEAARFLRNKP